jgi:hypothetical protein
VVPTVCCARPTHGTARVMAAEVVSHAFSQGFHPEHSQPLAACWAESLGGRTTYSDCYGGETSVVRLPRSSRLTTSAGRAHASDGVWAQGAKRFSSPRYAARCRGATSV